MKETQFYADNGTGDFSDIKIDDTVQHVYIETPEGWTCKRKGCKEEVLHEHTVYSSLKSN